MDTGNYFLYLFRLYRIIFYFKNLKKSHIFLTFFCVIFFEIFLMQKFAGFFDDFFDAILRLKLIVLAHTLAYETLIIYNEIQDE